MGERREEVEADGRPAEPGRRSAKAPGRFGLSASTMTQPLVFTTARSQKRRCVLELGRPEPPFCCQPCRPRFSQCELVAVLPLAGDNLLNKSDFSACRLIAWSSFFRRSDRSCGLENGGDDIPTTLPVSSDQRAASPAPSSANPARLALTPVRLRNVCFRPRGVGFSCFTGVTCIYAVPRTQFHSRRWLAMQSSSNSHRETGIPSLQPSPGMCMILEEPFKPIEMETLVGS
ncbi:hypothetical protein CIRG_01468 [Coccidioides immitis RMSCC 2394]|uniref:Uncharacterized protein n=1 Tax=Coccidioides immitis RMSCC 2394 TaxID=404692 RepID=A0A0J6Y3W6_COCIT|nr:hypothetical protein CIRG_01468 [Coccidioides immitis RMSCC 2394]